MSVFGFDVGHNKVAVPEESDFNTLALAVLGKQADLSATDGTAQEDANEVKTTGIYYIPSTADNVPSAHDYVLLVFSLDTENSTVMQVAISVNGTYIYTRMYANTYFTEWKRWASYSYVNNTFPVTYSGDTVPDDANGKNGDFYYYIINNKISNMYVKLNNMWLDVLSNMIPIAYSGNTIPSNATGKNGDTYYYISNNKIQTMYVKVDNNWLDVMAVAKTTYSVTYSGTETPTNSIGKNGDHYYYLVEGAIQTTYVKLNDTWMEVT